MSLTYNQLAKESPQPHNGLNFEVKCEVLEEKWLLGQNAPKIDRIYSNDSNIETAEGSAYDSNEPRNSLGFPVSPPLHLQKPFSSEGLSNSNSLLQFRKYQSDLANQCLIESVCHSIFNRPVEEAAFGTAEEKEDSVILQEQRQSNHSLSFEGESFELHVNSIVKPSKSRLQHSFMVNSHSSFMTLEQCRNYTLNEDTRAVAVKLPTSQEVTGLNGISVQGVMREDDRNTGLSESRVRKNACLKKKATLTNKDSSWAQFQEEENWLNKSSKRVNFKGSQNEEPKMKEIPRKPLLTPKKTNKRVESITSICLSGKNNPSEDDGESLIAPLLKSSRTLHDQGNNHLIFRLRGDKSMREKACQSIEASSSEDERREREIFMLMRRQNHQNILKLHSMNTDMDSNNTERTLLLQTVDFYPKNLHQYLVDLSESNVSAQQSAFQRKIILFQILNGLRFLHSRQITHRNLTPASILLSQSLQVAIANFSFMDSPELTQRRELRCEWLIRPPQVILQPRFAFGASGDIWQFGCLVVFMLRQRMPFLEYSDANLIVEMSKCIGRPSGEDRTAIGLPPQQKKFIFPSFRRESMGKNFKCQDKNLVEMLRRIFVFNPFKRASASELMRSPYFDELRESRASLGDLLTEQAFVEGAMR